MVSEKKIFKISANENTNLVEDHPVNISGKLGRNVHWMVLYKIFVFGADRKSNMAARVHNVFSLAEILKIFLSETTMSIELMKM
jgi:hypothetical protein